MAKYKRMVESDKGGWSDWVYPLQNYRMACCDCGLVHELQFGVLKHVSGNPNGTFIAKQLEFGPYRVEFRARRNERSTSAVRRHRKR